MEKVTDSGGGVRRISAAGALTFGLLSGLTLGAFFLRFQQLGDRSLAVDEAMSAVFAAKPLPELFRLLVTEDVHPPLYPLLLHYWMAIAGSSELAVRFPSLVFGVFLVPLIYLTGQRLESMVVGAHGRAPLPGTPQTPARRGAIVDVDQLTRHGEPVVTTSVVPRPGRQRLKSLLRTVHPVAPDDFGNAHNRAPTPWTRLSPVGAVGAAIAATSAYYIGYSQGARNYMAVTFLGLLSSYLLLRALSTPGWRSWAAYGAATLAALYTHYTAFLLVAFHLAFMVVTWRSNGRAWRPWLLSLAAAGVAYLPWVGYSISQLERISDYWPGTLEVESALRTSVLLFVSGGGVGPAPVILPLLLGLALLVVGSLALVAGAVRGKSSQPIFFLLLNLVVPSAILIAITYYRPKFDPRYLLVVTPAFYLTLAWGIAALLKAGFSWRVPAILRGGLVGLGALALAATIAASAVYGEPAKLMHVGDGRTGMQDYGDFRSLAAYIDSHAEPGDAVVLMMNVYHPYVYYSKLQLPWYPMEPFDDFDGAIIRLNRMVERQQGRLWFILWQTQWADPADYVMHVMEDQAREIRVDGSFGAVGLRLFELIPGQRFSYYPRVDRKTEAIVQGKLLEFWGWNVSKTRVAAGDSVRFDLHWIPQRPIDAGLKLKTKVMLMDGELRQWGNVDQIMVGPFYPPSRWKENVILHDPHTLTVPSGTPPGAYQAMLLVYDENTMTDLAFERWSGESLGTLLPLATITVTAGQ